MFTCSYMHHSLQKILIDISSSSSFNANRLNECSRLYRLYTTLRAHLRTAMLQHGNSFQMITEASVPLILCYYKRVCFCVHRQLSCDSTIRCWAIPPPTGPTRWWVRCAQTLLPPKHNYTDVPCSQPSVPQSLKRLEYDSERKENLISTTNQ